MGPFMLTQIDFWNSFDTSGKLQLTQTELLNKIYHFLCSIQLKVRTVPSWNALSPVSVCADSVAVFIQVFVIILRVDDFYFFFIYLFIYFIFSYNL